MLKFTLEPQKCTRCFEGTWYCLETFAPIELELVKTLEELNLPKKELKNELNLGEVEGQYYLKISLPLKKKFMNKGTTMVIAVSDVVPDSFGPHQFRELFFSNLRFAKEEKWFCRTELSIAPKSCKRIVEHGDGCHQISFETEECEILTFEDGHFILSRFSERGNEMLYFSQQDYNSMSSDVYCIPRHFAIKRFSQYENTNDIDLIQSVFGTRPDEIL